MHNEKTLKNYNLHNYANETMQRVFAAIYAIYKKVVLKHNYNK